MKEIWKDIEGYEGLYQVSSYGNVRSLDRIVINKNGHNKKITGRVLMCGRHTGGYVSVTLSKNSKAKSYIVHRLVAKSFVENKENKPEVNHIDGVKTNNYYKNLEWSTSSDNTYHGLRLGIMNTAKGVQKPNSKLNEEKVLEIKKRIKEGQSNIEISKDYGVHYATIHEIRKNKNWKWVKTD